MDQSSGSSLFFPRFFAPYAYKFKFAELLVVSQFEF